MAKAKLGSGQRFKALVSAIKKHKGIKDAKAIAAAIGRKKYGARKMAKMAASGRKRHK